MHVVNAYPQDAVKVVAKTPLAVGKWTHVTVAYDGTGKSGGVKIYYDGEPQPTDVEADTLKSTTRTTVPLKIGQRSTTGRVAGVAARRPAHLRPAVHRDRRATGVGVERTADVLAKPADKRTPQENEDLYTRWLVSRDTVYLTATAEYRKVQAEEVAIRARGTIAHVMNEKPGEPGAFVLFRGDYDKRATR